MESDYTLEDVVLGRIKGLGWVTVSPRLTLKTSRIAEETTEHAQISQWWRFAMSASVWPTVRSSDITEGGQIISTLEGSGLPQAERLVPLWKRWHLNDMRSSCAHMPPRTGDQDPAPCPVTGYRYGSLWLVEPIPDDVLTEIRAVLEDLSMRPDWQEFTAEARSKTR